jgi:hypothetical protein
MAVITYTWIDGTTGDWGTASDWSGGVGGKAIADESTTVNSDSVNSGATSKGGAGGNAGSLGNGTASTGRAGGYGKGGHRAPCPSFRARPAAETTRGTTSRLFAETMYQQGPTRARGSLTI